MTRIYQRIFLGLGMICLIAWVPWWITAVMAIVLAVYFTQYYEIIIWGVMMDALYGSPESFTYTISAVIVIACILSFRRRFRTLQYGSM